MIMAEDRKACPRDDIVTRLVSAEVDGDHLSADEFGFFMVLLAVAGNETTRNAISHGMHAYFEHPEQWELFKAGRPVTAADEIVRWATPVTSFQRTARYDTELGGQQIKRGQRVGLFYRSANFDEEVFDQPERFDITRDPNPHLGFGGSGAHFCLGASLARLEIELIFDAIADGMPGIAPDGAPERLRSGGQGAQPPQEAAPAQPRGRLTWPGFTGASEPGASEEERCPTWKPSSSTAASPQPSLVFTPRSSACRSTPMMRPRSRRAPWTRTSRCCSAPGTPCMSG